MAPKYHLTASTLLAVIFFYSFNDLNYSILAIIIGFLLDLDHLLEFCYNQPKNFWRLKLALSGHHFQQSGKIRVLFHAWEYLIIWTTVWLGLGWYKLGLVTSLPYLTHLLMDHFGNGTCGPFYFLLYRLKHNFNIKKLCRKIQ